MKGSLSRSQLQQSTPAPAAVARTATPHRTRVVKPPPNPAITLQTTQLSMLSDDLRTAEKQVLQGQQEAKRTKETMEDLRAKNRILEDALLFRSEEMGLAGHAGLLSKVAQLKGEVTALRNELTNKVEKLQYSEEEKSSLSHSQEDLQEQMGMLTKRLAEAEQLNYKLTANSTHDLLVKVEQERDLLLQYIQQDMAKSNTLALQLEAIESDARMKTKQCRQMEDSQASMTNQIQQLQDKCQALEAANQDLDSKHRELQYAHSVLEKECNHVTSTLTKKLAEEDEQKKMQGAVYSQMKSREKELLSKSDELLQLRSKLMEVEHHHSRLQAECALYHDKVISLEAENKSYSAMLSTLQPKVLSLEPLAHQLTIDNQQLVSKYDKLSAEYNTWKEIVGMYQNLEEDLQTVDEAREEDFASSRVLHKSVAFSAPGTPAKYGASTASSMFDISTLLSSPLQASIAHGRPAVTAAPVKYSAKHALWIGLPSLRKYNSKLYTLIRSLASDLHALETAHTQLQSVYASLQEDSAHQAETTDKKCQQLASMCEEEKQKYNSLYSSLSKLEQENVVYREAYHVVHQVQLVLQAYPGHKDALERHFRTTVDQMSVNQIPEAVNQALLSNGESALRLQELETQTHGFQREVQSLYTGQQSNAQTIREQQQVIATLKDQLAICEKSYANYQTSSKSSIAAGAELAEKQNVLLVTLQAKIDSIERDRQLRIAQCSTMQQREENIRNRVLSNEFVYNNIPPHWQQHHPSLSDLVGFLVDMRVKSNASTGVGSSVYNPPPVPAAAHAPAAVMPSSNAGVGNKYGSTTSRITASNDHAGNTNESNGNAATSLQDRLRKAHQSFAAMREIGSSNR